jgi:hypothetical protein
LSASCRKSTRNYGVAFAAGTRKDTRSLPLFCFFNRDHPYEAVLQAVERALQCGNPSLSRVLLVLNNIGRADSLIAVKPILEIPVDDPAKFDRLLGGAIA